MQRSEQINELSKALSAFQGEVEDAHKDAQGYGYKYATLGAVLALIRPLAAKHGISFTQICEDKGEKIALETVIMHESGQWISGTLAFDLPEPIITGQGKKKNTKAQDCGSVITYMRRYALTAMFGITQTDEDAAQKEEPQEPAPIQPKKPTQKYQPKQAAAPVPQPVQTITPEHLAELGGYILTLELSEDRVKGWLDKAKVTNLTELPDKLAQHLIKQCKDYEENLKNENEAQQYQYEV